MTADEGLTEDPAVSPDGKLLAYASDRAGEGNLDIWVQSVPAADRRRLTRHPADDREPEFSPDGTTIAFRSERGAPSGGIYLIPALGGEERLLVKGGRRPRFSPDGQWIAYWVGPSNTGEAMSGGAEQVYIVAATGGAPRRFQPDFAVAMFPVWSPDSKHILFLGSPSFRGPLGERSDWASADHGADERLDWWVAPREGGTAVRTGAADSFHRRRLDFSIPDRWLAGNRILFSAQAAGGADLREARMTEKTWQFSGDFRNLTVGAFWESQPSVATDGELVYSKRTYVPDIWSLPLDANRGKVTGEPRNLTRDTAMETEPCVSLDGRKLVYSATQNSEVILRDLETGKEWNITGTPSLHELAPQISADGTRIFYETRAYLRDVWATVYGRTWPEGAPEKICERCRVRAISSDGSHIVFPDPERPANAVAVLDVASRKKTVLLEHARFRLAPAHFSPDDRWIVFRATIKPDSTRLFVARFQEGVTLAEKDWIPVTDGAAWDDKPRWSPDGNLIYFLSERDGFRCLWAQRLAPATKRPLDAPFAVRHFHSARLSPLNMDPGPLEMSVAWDKIILNLGEITGNIWAMLRTGRTPPVLGP